MLSNLLERPSKNSPHSLIVQRLRYISLYALARTSAISPLGARSITMPKRRQVKHALRFSDRLKMEAQRLRQEAENKPPGPKRAYDESSSAGDCATHCELGFVAGLEAADIAGARGPGLLPTLSLIKDRSAQPI
jgi:hypothetical protein